MGYQPAATGDAYVGMYCHGDFDTVREYIGAQLLIPLQVGQKYKVEFKAVLTESQGFGGNCAINRLGVLFTNNSYAMGFPCIYNQQILYPRNYAHVYTNNFISDTASWTVISGEFIADSSYRYIVIGNFFDPAHTIDTILHQGICSVDYYIDDVSVVIDTITSISIIQNKPEISINVFPNPANSSLKISLPEKIIYNIEIISFTSGLLLQKKSSGFSDMLIDTSNIPDGFYFINITSDKNKFLKKLIINH